MTLSHFFTKIYKAISDIKLLDITQSIVSISIKRQWLLKDKIYSNVVFKEELDLAFNNVKPKDWYFVLD